MKPEHYIEQAFGDRTKEETSLLANVNTLVILSLIFSEDAFDKKEDLYDRDSKEFDQQFLIASKIGKGLGATSTKSAFHAGKKGRLSPKPFWTCSYDINRGDIRMQFNLSYAKGKFYVTSMNVRKKGRGKDSWVLLVRQQKSKLKKLKKGNYKNQIIKYFKDTFKKHNEQPVVFDSSDFAAFLIGKKK